MNRINPDKLHHSKWTAVSPQHKEKHFLVVELVRDDHDHVAQVVLEAVLSKRQRILAWRELKDDAAWLAGWR